MRYHFFQNCMVRWSKLSKHLSSWVSVSSQSHTTVPANNPEQERLGDQSNFYTPLSSQMTSFYSSSLSTRVGWVIYEVLKSVYVLIECSLKIFAIPYSVSVQGNGGLEFMQKSTHIFFLKII